MDFIDVKFKSYPQDESILTDCLSWIIIFFSDLRHMLERKKYRKLTKEEKAYFFGKAEFFINKVVSKSTLPQKLSPILMEG